MEFSSFEIVNTLYINDFNHVLNNFSEYNSDYFNYYEFSLKPFYSLKENYLSILKSKSNFSKNSSSFSSDPYLSFLEEQDIIFQKIIRNNGSLPLEKSRSLVINSNFDNLESYIKHINTGLFFSKQFLLDDLILSKQKNKSIISNIDLFLGDYKSFIVGKYNF